MKKWKSGKNRDELYLLGQPVCVLHYSSDCGYWCTAQIGNGIEGESFGFCTGFEARANTEAWYAAKMRTRYQLCRVSMEECLGRLKELEATEE